MHKSIKIYFGKKDDAKHCLILANILTVPWKVIERDASQYYLHLIIFIDVNDEMAFPVVF